MKQYFEASPEIDICKKAINAYLAQDWKTFRSCYSETAQIWHNKYFTKYPPQNIDEIIKKVKEVVVTLEYIKYEGIVWEMIIQNGGQNWTHFWGNLVVKQKGSSDEIDVAVHKAFSIENEKIVIEAGFWDNLPLYLENQKLNKKNETNLNPK